MEPMNIGIMLGVREDPEESLEQCRKVGVTCAQLGCPPDDWFNVNKARDVAAMFADAGVLITTVFAGFAGESYSDIPTVQRTVGYLPEAMREERIVKTFQVAEFARAMGVSRIAAHFGFIPEDPCDVRYSACVETMRRICDYLEAKGMSFGLETGQETAGTLVRFLEDVGVDNLNVNFDPANMILYGTEDPIDALNIVSDYIVSVHCKDGTWPDKTTPEALGVEVPLGEGEVGISRFVAKLKEIGYTDALTIEREVSPPEQVEDMKAGKALLEQLRG